MKANKLTRETILDLGVTKRDFPDFRVGDTIEVHQLVREGDKERVQIFEGDVIARRNNGISSTFIVRKVGAHAVPVERIYPYHSPVIKEIKVVRRGKVRRAQAYYMRDRVGKAARFEEKILKRQQREMLIAQAAAARAAQKAQADAAHAAKQEQPKA